MIPFENLYRRLPGNGWLTEKEAKLLYNSARRTTGPILEVGSYYGRSTVLLGNLDRQVYAVDPFDGFDSDISGDDVERRLKDNIRDLPVTIFRQRIEDWKPQPVGFAYLDGDHTYQGTINQIEKALLCDPSIIAIHDVNDSGDGAEIKRAAVEKLGGWDDRIERLAIWVL